VGSKAALKTYGISKAIELLTHLKNPNYQGVSLVSKLISKKSFTHPYLDGYDLASPEAKKAKLIHNLMEAACSINSI
jgi:hypothetical protein